VVYYEIVIQIAAEKKPILKQIIAIHKVLVKASNEVEILELLEKSDTLYESIEPSAESLHSAFLMIEILCLMNLTFLL